VDMLKTDPRKVERKHTGLYKARAKYPYRRRWSFTYVFI